MTDQPIDPRMRERIREVRSEKEAWAHLRSMAANDNSSAEEIAGMERMKARWAELGFHEPRTERGNAITHDSQTSLGDGRYLHLGHSAEGFHTAVETPEGAQSPYTWGHAYPTAREGTDAAIASMDEGQKMPVNEVTATPPTKTKRLIDRLCGHIGRIIPRSQGRSL